MDGACGMGTGEGVANGEAEHRKKGFRPTHSFMRVRLEFARPVASFNVTIFKTVINASIKALAGTVGGALHDVDVLSYEETARTAVLRMTQRSATLVQSALCLTASHDGMGCRIAVVDGPTPFLMALASERFF